MFHLKHDIQIHLKNEKEVFQFLRLLIFTFLLSAVLLGLPDYIWNMTLYRISKLVVPWLVAIPAIISCREQHITIKDMLGTHVVLQILLGVLFGTILAIFSNFACSALWPGQFPVIPAKHVSDVLFSLFRYLFVVGMTEELIFRVAFIGAIQRMTGKSRWVAYIVADLLFAASHLFQSNMSNVVFTLLLGAAYTALYKWKKGGYVMAVMAHGVYDFMIIYLPLLKMQLFT